jgi:xanthine dehydrogenase accessory factor
MERKLATWQLIRDSLEKNLPVMLLYVLESSGSSPGRQGFFMAVNAAGEMKGSIGGGIMEYKFVEMARERLKAPEAIRTIRKQIHDKSAPKDQSGMICSGEQTVWIYSVQLQEAPAIRNFIEVLERNGTGTLQLSPDGISFSPTEAATKFEYNYHSDTQWVYTEQLGYGEHLYIIGGGHCALALSRIMATMDFCIHVFDDREGLNTMEQNSFAHHKQLLTSYAGIHDFIPPGVHTWVVIMTLGYRTDDMALRSMLGRELRYLGLLGSRNKIEKMFADYRSEGVRDELLQKVHAPVGLDIKSQTPEEIAISIAAEIVREKNRGSES